MLGILIQRKAKNKTRIKAAGSPSQTLKKIRLPKKKDKRKIAFNRTRFLNPDFTNFIINRIIARTKTREIIN